MNILVVVQHFKVAKFFKHKTNLAKNNTPVFQTHPLIYYESYVTAKLKEIKLSIAKGIYKINLAIDYTKIVTLNISFLASKNIFHLL